MKFNLLKIKKQRARQIAAGFTLIELLISISIFAFMTAFLVAKYGTFNQSVLLTNLAYDTALSVRSAQSYGLNVQGYQGTSSAATTVFNYAYGVHFDSSNPTSFILFVDLCGDDVYRDLTKSNETYCPLSGGFTIPNSGPNAETETVSTYTMRSGFTIDTAKMCVGSSASSCTKANTIDVAFRRPNPDAIITSAAFPVTYPLTKYFYAKIPMVATDGSTKSIVVQSTGQIAVTN